MFDAFGYMKGHGLPDESCMTYSATDHSNVTVDWKKLKSCPLDAVCRNCMPLNDTDPGTCWAVKAPVLYKLASYGKVEPAGEHGGCRGVCSACPPLRQSWCLVRPAPELLPWQQWEPMQPVGAWDQAGPPPSCYPCRDDE